VLGSHQDEAAYAYCRRVNRSLHFKREANPPRYGLSSVCYEGGHLSALVRDDTAEPHFPTERPFYE
jgi:hypothetical protein